MDIVLGVSMAPTTVRMVLVEGQNADGVTVDEDGFEVPADADLANTGVADQVIAAILGTRESAAEGDYHLASTGVTWTDPAEAAALRDALAAHKVENVMLVSAFLAAAALAQAVGSAVGYAHTGLLFLEPETATLAIVDSADGSIADVRRRPLSGSDAATELADMMAGLEALESRPDGVFVVGCGVDVTAIKPRLETATALPVNAPEEPETALARGAALAAANAPLFASSTAAVAYAQVPDWTTAEVVEPGAAADLSGFDDPYAVDDADFGETEHGRKPFLVALSVMMVFFVGVLALVISLAVAVRPAVSQRPSSGGNLVVPAERMPAPAPKAEVPAPPAAPPNKVEQPAPEVQQVPREAPAPEAPAPAPAPAAPAPAPVAPAPVQVPAAAAPAPEAPAPAPQAPPAPPPAAPAPVPVPVPVPVAPVVPLLPPIFNPPGNSSPWQPGGGDRDRGGWQPGGGDRDRGGWQPGGGGGWFPGGGDHGGGGRGGGDHGGGFGGFGGIGGGFGGFGGGHGGFGGRGH
ncbi:DUF7159 family protein [Mycobacterium celatum]|uniref:DUF7159 family protein n=1 Tax=Mycobacterium celatum TaxID=28045 RepID=UPI0015D4D42F|nr:hypothetical protein [Mycobacterium celatum]